jgi:hypothetical protein
MTSLANRKEFLPAVASVGRHPPSPVVLGLLRILGLLRVLGLLCVLGLLRVLGLLCVLGPLRVGPVLPTCR